MAAGLSKVVWIRPYVGDQILRTYGIVGCWENRFISFARALNENVKIKDLSYTWELRVGRDGGIHFRVIAILRKYKDASQTPPSTLT